MDFSGTPSGFSIRQISAVETEMRFCIGVDR